LFGLVSLQGLAKKSLPIGLIEIAGVSDQLCQFAHPYRRRALERLDDAMIIIAMTASLMQMLTASDTRTIVAALA
jgi:hypothetical protein